VRGEVTCGYARCSVDQRTDSVWMALLLTPGTAQPEADGEEMNGGENGGEVVAEDWHPGRETSRPRVRQQPRWFAGPRVARKSSARLRCGNATAKVNER